MEYDFTGWATRANLKCSDGRTILKDAFKHNDGQTVPLVWNHQYSDVNNVLGHALLENRKEGVYAYCKFNDTEAGRTAKLMVQHGDVNQLSIFANQLKQEGHYVKHGNIRELSLVLAGANPGAYIDNVIKHGDSCDDEAVIFTGEDISLTHSDDEETITDVFNTLSEKQKTAVYSIIGDVIGDDNEDDYQEENGEVTHSDNEETVADVFSTLSEKQKTAVYTIIGMALEDGGVDEEDDEYEEDDNGGNEMKHNVFDQETTIEDGVLSHSVQMNIINMAKTKAVGSLQDAISIYAEENGSLSHGIDDVESLFPEYRDVRPGAPELIQRDQGWVSKVMQKTHKSPISRIRTRQVDVRDDEFRANGYQKGKYKKEGPNLKLLKRTTDPQTIYRKDALHRDDINDITDFDVVEYQYGIMRQNLEEEVARAILIGDGRDDGDEMKIYQEHVRSIWHDDELYAIHADVDIKKAKAELQGTNTGANFGENYIYAEATITAALYSREQYKGSGTPDFYCTPHLLNIMLLARDLNGRRIYDSKTDLQAALNVGEIITVEQFEGKVRQTEDSKKKKLLGIFVNLEDYYVGATKGGEITKFNQFDIDFNQEKYLIETRISGALTRIKSAIVLEEDITEELRARG